MTREEFIKGYCERSDIRPTRNGALLGNRRMFALPCTCDMPQCEGWAMVTEEQLHDHLCTDAPEPLRQTYLDAVGSWF